MNHDIDVFQELTKKGEQREECVEGKMTVVAY
jgi:hypothetical protein